MLAQLVGRGLKKTLLQRQTDESKDSLRIKTRSKL